jgi:hypothetical protein
MTDYVPASGSMAQMGRQQMFRVFFRNLGRLLHWWLLGISAHLSCSVFYASYPLAASRHPIDVTLITHVWLWQQLLDSPV